MSLKAGGINKRMNERMNERKSPCVLQDIVPFGAAAQKQKSLCKKGKEIGKNKKGKKLKGGGGQKHEQHERQVGGKVEGQVRGKVKGRGGNSRGASRREIRSSLWKKTK